MLNNRLLRSAVAILLFARILWSYVVFGLFFMPRQKGTSDGRKSLRIRLDKLHAKNAMRVYNAFSLLKGVYIKVGQFLSTQAMLPPQYLSEMVKMQDRVPVASTEAIHQRILEQYGKPVNEVFGEFDDEPLACASIGQVHRVKLLDGRDAVVKVKYPGIDKSFHNDLNLLKLMVPWFVRIIEIAFYRQKTGIDHRATIGEFVKYIRMELDYGNEVINHRKMFAIMQDRDDIIIPRLNDSLCTSATICMEFIDAWKMHDFFTASDISDNLKNRAYSVLADSLLFQVSKYGFFQADTHPGNFLVKFDAAAEDPESTLKIVMLDFGCSKQLPNEFRQGILKAFQGFINRDAQMAAQAYWDMGFRTKQHTIDSLSNWAEFVFGIIAEVIELFAKGESLTDFMKNNMMSLSEKGYSLAQSDSIDNIPEEYIMFGRALATPPVPFDQFQPTTDLMAIAMPHIMYFSQPQAEIEATALLPSN